jgi:hypothetical protein
MKLLSTVALSVTLVACGGGGGGGPAPTPVVPVTPTAPAQIAALNVWKSLMVAGGNWSSTGKGSDGATYDITTVVTPAAVATLIDNNFGTIVSNKTYNASNITTTTRKNGAMVGSDTRLFYLDVTTAEIKYLVDPSGPSCSKAKSSSAPPVSAVLNGSGLLFTGEETVYKDSTCSSSHYQNYSGDGSLTWSYEYEPNVPLFCINYTMSKDWLGDGIARRTTVQATCLEVTPSSTVGGKIRMSVSDTGFTLLAKNY